LMAQMRVLLAACWMLAVLRAGAGSADICAVGREAECEREALGAGMRATDAREVFVELTESDFDDVVMRGGKWLLHFYSRFVDVHQMPLFVDVRPRQ